MISEQGRDLADDRANQVFSDQLLQDYPDFSAYLSEEEDEEDEESETEDTVSDVDNDLIDSSDSPALFLGGIRFVLPQDEPSVSSLRKHGDSADEEKEKAGRELKWLRRKETLHGYLSVTDRERKLEVCLAIFRNSATPDFQLLSLKRIAKA